MRAAAAKSEVLNVGPAQRIGRQYRLYRVGALPRVFRNNVPNVVENERVAPLSACHSVGTRAAVQQVICGIADNRIRAGAANRIFNICDVVGAAISAIGTARRKVHHYAVRGPPKIRSVGTWSAVNDVVSCTSIHFVAANTTSQKIVLS